MTSDDKSEHVGHAAEIVDKPIGPAPAGARGGRRQPRAAGASPRDKSGGKGASEGNVGSALRSAYEETVRETVPQEMLDLLGKLS